MNIKTRQLTPEGLHRWRESLNRHTETGGIPGLVAVAQAAGKTEIHAAGRLALGGPPIQRDTIFRVASMTKPVAAVAAMILVEEGVVTLDEPVDRWLPELANRRVLRRLDGPLDDTVPAPRPLTLRDLLSLRLGIGYIFADTRGWPIQEAFNRLGILQGPPHPGKFPDTDCWIAGVGELPLLYPPGERWMYDLGLDIAGVLIRRAAGHGLGEFLRARIFGPLGMKDTGFHVPEGTIDRLATSYETDPARGTLKIYDDARDSEWARPPAFESASSGLVSTAEDYLAFCQMLLGGGERAGVRILSPGSISELTRNHLTNEQRKTNSIFFGRHTTWGLGMAVDVERGEVFEHPGRFGWDGGLGTTARVDPANGVIGILLTQRNMDSPEPPKVFSDFWTGLYNALET